MAQYIDRDRAPLRTGARPGEDIKPEPAVYTLHFGGDGEYTAFHQDGDGTDPDDGEPWPTGLWIEPDGYDVTTEEPHEGDDPGPWRENPDHRRFYRELFALGKRWCKENEAFSSGGALPGCEAREAELRALYECYSAMYPGRVFTAAEERPAQW